MPKGDAKEGYLNTNAHLEAKVAMLDLALAESQSREASLRVGYARILNANDSQMRDGDMAREVSDAMLSIPTDDSALREMIAAAKVEEREMCAAACDALSTRHGTADECADAIRAMKSCPIVTPCLTLAL